MVIYRWHDNVSMFNEKNVLDPTKDKADFLAGFYGSYPNYFIDIHQSDLPDFFDLLTNLSHVSEEEARKRLNKYGVNRADKDFWEHYDWFQNRFNKEQPIQSGLFDLNRYFHLANEKRQLIE